MAETYSAGIVTAYGAAVRGGYTGTYDEFCTEQAGFAENAQQVAEDKAATEQLVSDFGTVTVPAAEQQIAAAGAAQVAAVNAAGQDKETDIAAAGAAQVTRVETTGTQTVGSVETAGSQQVAAVNAAGAAQVAAVAAEGTTQTGAVQAKGQEILDSIPEDYTALVDEVAANKEDADTRNGIVADNVFTAERVPQGADYYILEAGSIVAATGANAAAAGKAVRTKYIPIPDGKDLYCVFDAPGYRWMSWSYTGSTAASGSHINAAFQPAETAIYAKYVDGDKTIRLAFRREDDAVLQDSDIETIQRSMHLYYRPDDVEDLKAIIDKTTQDSINLVDMSSFASSSRVTVTHNSDGSVTFHADDNDQGSYVYYTLLTTALEPGETYCIRMRITACSATDINGDPKSPTVAMRFRGDWEASGHFSGGINGQHEPGDYAGMWLVSDQTSLVLVLTSGAKGEVSDVTISEIMAAKSDAPLPYIPHGITAKDSNVWAEAMAGKYNRMSYGVANALASARQFTQVRYTLQGTLPTQFADYRTMFVAGKEVEGLVYSSARYYDKMVGLHVSLYTFLSAIYNPRSVLYTRRLLTSNSRTYYGCVCSAFAGHNFGFEQNLTTDTFVKWTEKMQKIAMSAVRVGDILNNNHHVLMITDVAKDQYCRSVSVNYSEAGTPVVHRIQTTQWPHFLNLATGTRPYSAYRYLDIDNVGYTPSEFVKGFPDETPEYEDTASYPWPDIMCEFGDKCCLLINDPQLDNNQVMINVLDASGYDTITVSVDGVVKSTTSGAPADFAVTLDEAGLWEITMTGPGKSSNTSFIVVDATCNYDTSSHVVSWQVNSGNAVLSAIYTYGWEYQVNKNIRNNYCWPTDAEMGSISGTKNLTDYIQTVVDGQTINCTLGAKVALKTDYGVVSWLSTPELKLWEAVT